MNNLYRVSTRFEVSEIRSRICRHIARCLVQRNKPMSIDQITKRVHRTLPTENRVPVRTVVAWHVRHSGYFVRAREDNAKLPPKKHPTGVKHLRAA